MPAEPARSTSRLRSKSSPATDLAHHDEANQREMVAPTRHVTVKLQTAVMEHNYHLQLHQLHQLHLMGVIATNDKLCLYMTVYANASHRIALHLNYITLHYIIQYYEYIRHTWLVKSYRFVKVK